jgi:hypothetical protein
MGVFFNEAAVTFDQGPFALSATVLIRDELIKYLKYSAHYSDADLAALAPGLMGFTGLTGREGNVTGYNVQGEFLSNPPATLFDRIGSQTSLPQGAPDLTLQFDSVVIGDRPRFRWTDERLRAVMEMKKAEGEILCRAAPA